MRLRHADRQAPKAVTFIRRNRRVRTRRVADRIGTVDLGCDRLNLLLDRLLEWVEELEFARCLSRRDNDLRQLDRTVTTLSPMGRNRSSKCSGLDRDPFYRLDLLRM